MADSITGMVLKRNKSLSVLRELEYDLTGVAESKEFDACSDLLSTADFCSVRLFFN